MLGVQGVMTGTEKPELEITTTLPFTKSTTVEPKSETVRMPAEVRVSLDTLIQPNVSAKSWVDMHYRT
eukprot:IDg11929t1